MLVRSIRSWAFCVRSGGVDMYDGKSVSPLCVTDRSAKEPGMNKLERML